MKLDAHIANRRANADAYDILFFAACLAFLYLHLFVFPGTPIFYEGDHLIFLNDAWRMTTGQVIYRDFFQFTFPGTQLIYCVLIELFGTRFWILNFFILLNGLALAGLTVAVSRKVIENRWLAYLPAAIFMFFGFRWFGLDGSHRMISPLLALATIYCLLEKTDFRRVALAGACCALTSFFTQQRGLLTVAAVGAFLALEFFLRGRRGVLVLLKSEAVLGASFLAALNLLIAPFILTSGAQTFFGDTVFFISNYVQDSSANYRSLFNDFAAITGSGLTMSAVMIFYYSLVVLTYPAFFLYVWFRRRRLSRRVLRAVLLIGVVGLFLALGTFAPSPGRVFQISAPPLIILCWLAGRKLKSDLVPQLVAAGLAVYGCLLGLRLQAGWEVRYLEAPTGKIAFLSAVSFERYQWLLENAERDDYVFEVYNCTVNYPLQLRSPASVAHLLNTAYTPPWQVAQSVDSLEKKKARFVIWDEVWSGELETVEAGENLSPLLEYLRAKYHVRKDFTPYNNRRMQLWERNAE